MNALRVLDGGLRAGHQLEDETADRAARRRLADEIEEAARLCDRLEESGLRVAFELGGPERVRVCVRDEEGASIQELPLPYASDVARLMELSGIAG